MSLLTPQKLIPVLVLLNLSFSGCKPSGVEKPLVKENIIARVNNEALSLEEALTDLQGKYNAMDSARVVGDYIRNWIRQQSMIQKAKAVLTDFEKDKADLLLKYYNDLLVFTLQEKLVQERLDTSVEESEILEYYDANPRNFELKENIVRLRFYKMREPVKKSDNIWKAFVEGDYKSLERYKEDFASEDGYFFEEDSTWLSFNDILKEIPIVTYTQESYLNNNKYIRLSDNGFTYFVNILEFKVKDNVSPIEFERERIRDILINKRKVELMKQIEAEIVEETYRTQKIETY